MSKIERVYVEIGNICNLSCSFCPKTKRKPGQMTLEDFARVCAQVSGYTSYVYLHVMGEPLLHPRLPEILDTVARYGMKACITTNGTLLSTNGEVILDKRDAVHKVSVSLHAAEANGMEGKIDEYLDTVADYSLKLSEAGIFTVLRLWNGDGEYGKGKNEINPYIESRLKDFFPGEWQKRPSGYRLWKYVFLEYATVFEWPTESDAERKDEGFCHGLVDQIAILVDGSVTACCLDSEGQITLGNIFDTSLDSILAGDRARRMYEGMKSGYFTEDLCKRCTFSRRFSK